MRRARVVYRPEALGDLRQIYLNIADISQSNVTANRFVKRIMARCHKIGDAPNGGRLGMIWHQAYGLFLLSIPP